MLIALDFPPQASFKFQIPSVEVHRDIHDSDELSRQIVTAKVGRDVTTVGYTAHAALYWICSIWALISVLSPIHLYYTFFLAAEALDKRLKECFSDARDPRVQFPVSAVQLIYA